MKMHVTGWALALAAASLAGPALAQGAVSPNYRWLTFAVFAAIIGMTMYVTFLAAKRVKTAADFYTAGGGVFGAFAEVIRDPAFDDVTRSAVGDGLPLLRRDIGVGEDAHFVLRRLDRRQRHIGFAELGARLQFGAQLLNFPV